MEKKVYLLVYSNVIGDRNELKRILDNIPEVLNWRYDMPNSFYIISNHTAQVLVEKIYSQIISQSCRFFITEICSNYQGYLPKDSWTFINSVRKKI